MKIQLAYTASCNADIKSVPFMAVIAIALKKISFEKLLKKKNKPSPYLILVAKISPKGKKDQPFGKGRLAHFVMFLYYARIIQEL